MEELGLTFEWSSMSSVLARLVGAYLLAIPIGWQREKTTRSMGLRTFPLVALASAAYPMLGAELFPGRLDAQARVLAGLVTGIGFIGAGAILKLRHEEVVYGTATAASVWATGALGAAMAYGRLDFALLISALTIGTLRILTPVKQAVEKEPELDERAR